LVCQADNLPLYKRKPGFFQDDYLEKLGYSDTLSHLEINKNLFAVDTRKEVDIIPIR
jgi:hypothetical protein